MNNFLYWLIVLGLLSTFVIRFLVSSIWGIFLFSLGVYFILPAIADVDFLPLHELILWLDGLPQDSKNLMIPSGLTVIGFLIAFQTSTKSWKDQLNANLNIQVADRIDYVYTEIAKDITELEIYTNHYIRVLNDLDAQDVEKQIDEYSSRFAVDYLQSQNEKYELARNRLVEMQGEATRIFGKHSLVILNHNQAFELLNKCNQHLNKVTEKMWLLLPSVDTSSPDYREQLRKCSDIDALNEFSQRCVVSRQCIDGLSGNVRGKLTGKLINHNLNLLLNMVKLGPMMLELLAATKKGEAISDETKSKIESIFDK